MESKIKEEHKMEFSHSKASRRFFEIFGFSLIRSLLRQVQGTIGLVLLVSLVLMAILAPIVVPFDPEHVDVDKILKPPNSMH